MEDYIYIIIAIVLSVIGALNKSRKKKMAQLRDQENIQEPQSSIFDQFFEDPEFEEASPETVPQQQPVVADMLKTKSKVETVHERIKATKRVRNRIDTSYAYNEIMDETPKESILKDFSLKKAVVYSEILNMKY